MLQTSSLKNNITMQQQEIVIAYNEQIKNTKSRIEKRRKELENDLQPKLQELGHQLAKAENEYFTHKKLCDSYQQAIERDIAVIHDLKLKRTKAEVGKIEWIAETCGVLRKEDRFMTAQELYNKIIEIPEVKQAMRYLKSKVTLEEFKAKLERDAKLSNNTRKLSAHEDGFGLPYWVDKNGVPTEHYINRFRFASLINDDIRTL